MIHASVEEDNAVGPFTFAAVWHVKKENVAQFEALLRKIVRQRRCSPDMRGFTL